MENKSTNNGFLPPPKSFATNAIHTAQNPENSNFLSIVPPLVTSTNFKMYPPGIAKKYQYSRVSNPSRNILEECLAKLENGKYALCYASGLGSIMGLLSMFQSGDNILCSINVYGGTFKLFDKVARSLGIDVKFIDISEPGNIENHITERTKLVWMESPTNPLLKVLDIRAIAEVTKRNKIWLAVDNTFLTPYFQRPLELGADFVMHSLSKYINGHSDVIMGALVLKDDAIHAALRDLQSETGITPSPFDCHQVIRSLKTLGMRMNWHSKSALKIATFLENHPKIEKVVYPGLPSHPQHELSKKQTSGHSGIFSFYLKGRFAETEKVLNNLKIFTLAKSLGGYESLIAVPTLMIHEMLSKEEKELMNITENLLRMSVGLEDTDDLIDDLRNALSFI